MTRRTLLASLALGGLLAALPATAQDVTYFRIGTGPVGEARFPIGGILANALSGPPGARPCEKGGSCGVPGLIAVAQSTSGAVENIRAISARRLEAALAQADVASWAFHGTGPYVGMTPADNLRAVAMLYSDTLHVVTRKEDGLATLADLRDRRVSLGEAGSGTLVNARMVLAAHGLRERHLRPAYLGAAAAAEHLQRGEIDAFCVLDAAPVPSITDLAQNTAIALLPVAGDRADFLCRSHAFFAQGSIPGGCYPGLAAAVPTLEVGVLLVVGAEVPDRLVQAVTRALWQPATARLLAQGFPGGPALRLAGRDTSLGVPLHPGAEAFYRSARN